MGSWKIPKKKHGGVKIGLHEEVRMKERRSIAAVMDSWREKDGRLFYLT